MSCFIYFCLSVPKMRLKQEVQDSNENEEEDDRVCCPVCTHYLRKDVSLHDHLNTHPKQQVIEALIQLKDACKGFNPPASAHSKSSSSGSSSSSANTSDNTTETEATSASTTDESEERDETRNVEEPSSEVHVSPTLPSTSGGHIIQFPQFLANSSSVPPFIHVPVVTSTDRNSVSPCPAQVCVLHVQLKSVYNINTSLRYVFLNFLSQNLSLFLLFRHPLCYIILLCVNLGPLDK